MPHPIFIIGLGSIGLAAVANAAERSLDFVVLESGPDAGVTAGTWDAPADADCPTGGEWPAAHLQPLAALLAATSGGAVRFAARVAGVSRAGRDRLVGMKSYGRGPRRRGASRDRRVQPCGAVDNPKAGADGGGCCGSQSVTTLELIAL